MRKYKAVKVYQRPEIMKSLNFISDNLDFLEPRDVSTYAMNLYKMKILEP